MTTDWLDYCLAKPGAWRDEPWEGDVVTKVGPKIFAFLGAIDPVTSIGLKWPDREAADLWMERYPGSAVASAVHRTPRLEPHHARRAGPRRRDR